jgi:hypothetical protein
MSRAEDTWPASPKPARIASDSNTFFCPFAHFALLPLIVLARTDDQARSSDNIVGVNGADRTTASLL